MATKKTETETITPPAAPTATTASYAARTPVLHDGKRYEIGAPIDLTEAQAQRLAGKVEKATAGTESTDKEAAQ